jgi:hypothetical protein
MRLRGTAHMSGRAGRRSRVRSSTLLIAVLLFAGTVVALPRPAAAQIRKATFDVTVEGVQRGRWKVNKFVACNGWTRGQGAETMRFASTRPLRLKVQLFFRGQIVFLTAVGGGMPELPVRGHVKRSSTGLGTVAGPGVPCGEIPPLPPPTGCKERRFSDWYALSLPDPGHIQLANGELFNLPFRDCPLVGVSGFPSLMTTAVKQSTRQLLNPSYGRFILLGKNRQKLDEASIGLTGETTINWSLTFDRVR